MAMRLYVSPASEYPSDWYWEDDFFLITLKVDFTLYAHVSPSTWEDERFYKTALKTDARLCQFAPKGGEVDSSPATPEDITYVSSLLGNDVSFVKAALTRNGYWYVHINERLKQEREFVLLAVSNAAYAIEDAPLCLRDDEEIMLAVIKADDYGDALLLAFDRLQNDETFLAKLR